jgi:hypothetical protein
MQIVCNECAAVVRTLPVDESGSGHVEVAEAGTG